MVAYVKSQDQSFQPSNTGGDNGIDSTALTGTWINTNKATQGIIKAVVRHGQEGLLLQVFGAADPKPRDWGEVEVKTLFADGVSSDSAISFTAEYDFGFLETELQTNMSKGLLIVTTVNRFKDGSHRSDYFSREYFYKEPGSN